jgi:predicted glycosyltransferase
MIKLAKDFKPDVLVSRVSPLSGYASRFVRKPHITFTDTENVRLLDLISQPFADVILTSDIYLREHGKKQLRYPGYHELAYLHPKRFTPDETILVKAGIDPGKKYAIVRFVSWDAHHDIGHGGFSTERKVDLVKSLAKYLQVYISSEGDLPRELESLRLNVRAEYMHHILAFAYMFMGESATMASECAMLGTPAIYLNTERFGSTNSQADYGLLSLFPGSEQGQKAAIDKMMSIAQDDEAKEKTKALNRRMLRDKIDVSAFMTWFVENYPASFNQVKTNPATMDAFRTAAAQKEEPNE